MEIGTRVIYTEFGITKHGEVVFSCRGSNGVIYNDVLFDDGTIRQNRYDEELELEE